MADEGEGSCLEGERKEKVINDHSRQTTRRGLKKKKARKKESPLF